LGKVIGTVVASKKYADLSGVKFLIVQPLNHRRQPKGEPIVAVDTMRAGPGELVFLEDGREASFTLPTTFVPVDAAVVGIVDMVDVTDGMGYDKSRES
jgi:ethanolamine utilization protein EutN